MAARKGIVVGGQRLNPASAEDRARMAEVKAAAVRMRNFGAALSTIADKLHITEDDAEAVITEAVRELTAEDADTVRARQQATLNDIRRAMYPAMAQGDTAASGTLLRVLDHEAKLHPGVLAPQRLALGMDQETFTTTVNEDIRALGVDPNMDTPAEGDDEPWANT